MRPLTALYAYAEAHDMEVYYFPMRVLASVAFPDGVIAMDVDKLADSREETVCLAHEMGHIETGSFYQSQTPLAVRGKKERQADAWAIQTLLPVAKLKEALAEGCHTLWDLAERFQVTEAFIQKAVVYYQCKEMLPLVWQEE